MTIFLATLNLQANNKIIEDLENEIGHVQFQEYDYIEDVEDAIWDHNPDLIIISDQLRTKSKNNVLSDIELYQFIKDTRQERDVLFLVNEHRNAGDRLVSKLVKDEFYSILPIVHPIVKDAPDSLESFSAFFSNEHLPSLNHKNAPSLDEDGEDDFFEEPPTILNDEQQQTPNKMEFYLPNVQDHQGSSRNSGFMNRPIVSVFWSPISNVGCSSIMRSLGMELANNGRNVLLIELDYMTPKLSRMTGLTHQHRNLKNAIQGMTMEDKRISEYIVNNKLAEENLPHTHKSVKLRLRDLPDNLYALSRSTEISFENEPSIDDDNFIEKLFYQAKEDGFQHILVDVASDPNSLMTMLPLLFADEKYAVVDESFSTSGLYKIAMDAFAKIEIEPEEFNLIINKTREAFTGKDVAEFYDDASPVATIPYDEDLLYAQLDLKLYGGKPYNQAIEAFARRFGVQQSMMSEPVKKKGLFSK